MTHLAIRDVAALCARMAAVSRRLFETTGEWVAGTDDPVLQRTFATASHRHAWHTELWDARLPTIPAQPRPDTIIALDPSAADRGAAYREALDDLLAELGEVAERVDADLDPSTARTVTLVVRDLAELRARVP